jgi:hypothetical protein
MFSKPNLLVLAVAAVLLPVTIFSFLRWWPTRYYHHGLEPDLSVVRVQSIDGERRLVGLFALRDGVYFENEERFGFLSISSTCKQYRGILPEQYSLRTLKPIIQSAQFNSLAGKGAPRTGDGWYIRASMGSQRKCFFLTEEAAAKNPDSAPFMLWFNGTKASGSSNRQFVRDCSNEDTDYINHWCED